MIVVWLAVSAALIGIACISVVNALTFPRLRPAHPAQTTPVSVLIPARNEAPRIADVVRSLLAQDYPAADVIVLDDQSEDGTAEAARRAAGSDPRLRVVPGAPLPSGWLGKNWACQQLAGQATGDLLVFTDADVIWDPGALAGLVAAVERQRADLLTVWPTQITLTWSERLAVPLMALVVIGYLPELLVRFTPWRAFAAANGQCMAFRRSAYEAVGGHRAVAGQIVEDVALARRIKHAGQRLVMVDGSGLIRCRMYTSWEEVRRGYAKNILAGHGDRLGLLALSTVFHWAVLVLPWLWLVLGGRFDLGPGWPGWPLALLALGVGARALSAAVTRQRPGDALLLPLSAVLMTVIAAQAVWWRLRRGGPQWKGRALSAERRGRAELESKQR